MRPVLCMLVLVGCPSGEPSIEIGTGDREFESLRDGDEAVIIQGPQGGFHLLGSMRVSNIEPGDTRNLFDPNNPTVHFQVREDGERVDASNAFIQGLDPADRGNTFEVIGRFVFLDIEADDELVGSELTLSVDFEDVNGVVLRDEVVLTGVASPFNE